MGLSEVRTAGDYNREVVAPARWARVAGAAGLRAWRAASGWTTEGRRRMWAGPALIGLVSFALLLPFDRAINRGAVTVRGWIWGDTARVLAWLGEYGQGVSIAVVAAVIWRLDPPNRRRLVNWIVALLIAAVSLTAMKMLVGRPRPKFDDPWAFLGPFGQYPLGPGLGVRHAWEFWRPELLKTGALWSFPSSHAAYAAVMTVFLSRLYPRLRGLAVALAAVVCVLRVMYGSHHSSDVAVGAAVGAIAGRVSMGLKGRDTVDVVRSRGHGTLTRA